MPTLLLTTLLLSLTIPSVDARPSRRTVIEETLDYKQEYFENVRSNMQNLAEEEWKVKEIPLMGIRYVMPESWEVTFGKSTESDFATYRFAHGDYIGTYTEQYPSEPSFFISYKEFPEYVTLDMIKQDFEEYTEQPDTLYEEDNSAFIHEFELLEQTEGAILGKPALINTYTYVKASKQRKTKRILFPWGKRKYSLSYHVTDVDVNGYDKFLPMFEAFVDSFEFMLPEEKPRTANENQGREIEAVSDNMKTRTCERVHRRFPENQKMLDRINDRLTKRFGFTC